MEDVLEVYHRSYDHKEVLVCLDETGKQLVGETRQSRPPRPGSARAYDYEYQRNGVSNLFMLFAPLEGWRRVEVTDRRTKVDWARVVQKLVDEDYPDRERIVLVMDNLNTHHPASLYEAFEPAEARRRPGGGPAEARRRPGGGPAEARRRPGGGPAEARRRPGGGPADSRTAGDSLHAEARELAEHGGVGTGGAGRAVPEPPDP